MNFHPTRSFGSHLETLEPRIAPTTFVVNSLIDLNDPLDPAYEGTLRWAISESNSNGPAKDTIIFDPNVFDVGSTIALTKGQLPVIIGDLVIKGLGMDRVTLDGLGTNNRILVIDDGNADVVRTVSVSGVTITNGGNALLNGGAIFSAESLIISKSALTENKAAAGAGIYLNSGNLTISDSVIAGNTATYSAGGIFATSTGKITITNSLVSGNSAGGNAGGAYLAVHSTKGAISIQNTSFVSNVSGFYGGGLQVGLSNDKTSLAIKNSHFVDNTAVRDGGGLHIQTGFGAQGVKIALEQVVVASNKAGDGAGLWIDGSPGTRLTIKSGEIHNNIAEGQYPYASIGSGGGIVLNGVGKATLSNTTIANNEAKGTYVPLMGGYFVGGNGGGLYAKSSTVNIQNSLFAGNAARQHGGGAQLAGGGATSMSNSLFLGNSAGLLSDPGFGGAINASVHALTIVKSSFEGNSSGSDGGAIRFEGASTAPLAVTGSSLIGNQSAQSGGAIAIDMVAGTATLSNITISGNSAFAFGGGIVAALNSSAASLTVKNALLSGNTANIAGGMLVYGATGSAASISKSSFLSNEGTLAAGGLSLTGKGTVAIQGTTFSGNAATLYGGAIASSVGNGGVVEISKSAVHGNLAGNGGGIRNTSIDAILLSKTNVSGNFSSTDTTLATANISGNFTGYLPQTLKATKGTFVVENLNPSGAGSFKQALLDANASTLKSPSIVFDPALKGTILLDADLPIVTGNLTIKGLGGDRIAIDGANTHRILQFDDGSATTSSKISISGLSFLNGKASAGTGGAISSANESVAVSAAFFVGNKANDDGGALASGGGALSIQNSLFAANVAGGGGGAVFFVGGSNVNIQGTAFVRNTAESGGAIEIILNEGGSKALLNNISVINSSAGSFGGGIQLALTAAADKSQLSLTNSLLTGNSANSAGGGLYLFAFAEQGKVAVASTQFTNNQILNPGGNSGAAVFGIPAQTTAATLSNLTVANNDSAGNIGGFLVDVSSQLKVLQSRFSGNTAGTSGAALVLSTSTDGAVAISSTVFAGNQAASSSGALSLTGVQTTADLSRVTLVGNRANGGTGGGLLSEVAASLTLKNSIVSGNFAASAGGGLHVQHTDFAMSNTSVAGNLAGFGAGGALLTSNNSVALSKSSFTGNAASTISGAFYSETGAGALTIKGLSVTSNAAALAAGFAVSGLGATVEISGLTAARNASGGSAGAAYLAGDATHVITKSSFTLNHAANTGAAIVLAGTAKLDLSNSVIQANVAGVLAGGIYNFTGNPANLILSKNQISANSAPTDPNISHV